MCLLVIMCTMCLQCPQGPEEGTGSVELESLVFGSHSGWVLGAKPESSAIASRAVA